MTQPRPDFLMGLDKLQHLAHSKVLLNLHRGAARALEWVRVLEAMCNGCVVVSERSTDFDPLVPGSHIIFSRASVIAAVAEALLLKPDRLDAVRRNAYAISHEMIMTPSAIRLTEVADALIRGVKRKHTVSGGSTPAQPEYPVVPEPPPPASGLPELAAWAEKLTEPLRRHQASLAEESLRIAKPQVRFGSAQRRQGAEVGAIVVDIAQSAAAVQATIRSLETQGMRIDTVVAASERTAGYAGDVGPPRGRLLNAGLGEILADPILIIEAGHELFPGALRRLALPLATGSEGDEGACLAYGIMADALNGKLWNSLPLEPGRLARRAYVAAPFMARRTVLSDCGGFTEDVALVGYEYYELLCKIAAAGLRTAFLQQILGRGQPPRPPELGIASLMPDLAWAALRRSAPTLFP